MSKTQRFHYAGWSAYVNVVANFIGFVALFVFFAMGGPSGMINDVSSIFFSLTLIPLALLLHRMHRSFFPPLSLVVITVGIIAMLTAALLQSPLVFGMVEFEQSVRLVLAANAVIGVWLILNGILARVGSTLPPWMYRVIRSRSEVCAQSAEKTAPQSIMDESIDE